MTSVRYVGLRRWLSIAPAATPRDQAAKPRSPAAEARDQPMEVEVDASTFERDVIVFSLHTPVILDCYANWCEPCKKLTPKLSAGVKALNGAVRLAKLNVDNNPEVTAQLQVKNLPTVLVAYQGKLVDSFVGVLPDAQLAAFFDKIKSLTGSPEGAEGTEADAAHKEGLQNLLQMASTALELGDISDAARLYSQAASQFNAQEQAMAGLAICAIMDGNLEAAKSLKRNLLENYVKPGKDVLPEVSRAVAAVEIAEMAPLPNTGDKVDWKELLQSYTDKVAAHPNDLEARYGLAAAQLVMGKSEDGISNLLLVVRKSRDKHNSEAATMLRKMFEVLGQTNPLTVDARKRLSSLLFI